jgi:hypothetical protein
MVIRGSISLCLCLFLVQVVMAYLGHGTGNTFIWKHLYICIGFLIIYA